VNSRSIPPDKGYTERRLNALGLDSVTLTDIIMAGRDAVLDLTPHHPENSKGIIIYGAMTKATRDLLVPKGWNKHEPYSNALTVDWDNHVAIKIMRGNDFTGLEDKSPKSNDRKYDPRHPGKKAFVIRDAIRVNKFWQTYSENPDWFRELKPYEQGTNFQTWILLHNVSPDNFNIKDIRMELSLPIGMVGGYVGLWAERIIVPIPEEQDPRDNIVAPRGNDSPTTNYGIEVTPKQSVPSN
jgi:hypothetical protein